MRQQIRFIIQIIKTILRVPGYEWFSPEVREFMRQEAKQCGRK